MNAIKNRIEEVRYGFTKEQLIELIAYNLQSRLRIIWIIVSLLVLSNALIWIAIWWLILK